MRNDEARPVTESEEPSRREAEETALTSQAAKQPKSDQVNGPSSTIGIGTGIGVGCLVLIVLLVIFGFVARSVGWL